MALLWLVHTAPEFAASSPVLLQAGAAEFCSLGWSRAVLLPCRPRALRPL